MIQQSHSWAHIQTNSNLKRQMHSNVRSSPAYNSQDMETTWKSADRWMDKEDVTVCVCVRENSTQP